MERKDLAKLIIEYDDLPLVPVEMPEWKAVLPDGKLWAKTLMGRDRDTYVRMMLSEKKEDQDLLNATLIQMTACYEDGTLVFRPDQIPYIQQKSGKAIRRFVDASLDANGLTRASMAIVKNDSPAQTAKESSSNTVSPVTLPAVAESSSGPSTATSS